MHGALRTRPLGAIMESVQNLGSGERWADVAEVFRCVRRSVIRFWRPSGKGEVLIHSEGIGRDGILVEVLPGPQSKFRLNTQAVWRWPPPLGQLDRAVEPVFGFIQSGLLEIWRKTRFGDVLIQSERKGIRIKMIIKVSVSHLHYVPVSANAAMERKLT
jgi:hypothetical protein